ncbi:right-handed parallel beta-helix repeat-containing protein [Candidatus Peregrinibacteria bacterium]|nr:right-handed parallel beta-helix repeat-containing protein [Candidatus Peregrinibacteria bacterium]
MVFVGIVAIFVYTSFFYDPLQNDPQNDGSMQIIKTATMDGYNAEFVDSDIPKELNGGEILIVSFTFKNTGDKPWLVGNNFFLGAESDAVDFYLYRAAVPKMVMAGDKVKLKFLLIAPNQKGRYNLNFQMVQEGVRWFGDRIEASVEVEGTSLKSETLDFDKFDLQLSQNDLNAIHLFKEKTTEAGFRQYEYNDWRKIKLSYNGLPLQKAKLRIHGDTDSHFQSYFIKLKDNKTIDGKKQFRLILFAEREYNALINYYFSKALDLMMLEHRLVLVSVNGGDYNLYYLRDSKTSETLENNEFSNSAYVKREFFDDPLLRMMITTTGHVPGHRTFIDYEMSNQEIQDGLVDKQKAAYVFYKLEEAIRTDADTKKLLDFFDFEYLAKFEALRDILLTFHDVDGDNLSLIYSESTGKIYPVPGGEIVYRYGTDLFESNANRTGGVGDLFRFFSKINQDSNFRQAKYRYLYKLIKDPNNVIGLGSMLNLFHKSLKKLDVANYAGVENSRISSRLVIDNLNLLENKLGSGNLLLLMTKVSGGYQIKLNPLSLSALDVEKMIIRFKKPIAAGSSIALKIDAGGDSISQNINFEKSTSELDLAKYFDFPMALGLTSSMFPNFNEVTVTVKGAFAIKDIDEIAAFNTVTEEALEQDNIHIFPKENDYKKFANDLLRRNFNYQMIFESGQDLPKPEPINEDRKERLEILYSELWQKLQEEITDAASFAADNVEALSSLIGYYAGTLNYPYQIDLARYEISSNKIRINILRKGSVIEFEILPITLAKLSFTKFVLNFDNVIPKGQFLNLKIYDLSGKLIKERSIRIASSGSALNLTSIFDDFDFSSERSETSLIPAKYRIVVDFIGNQKVPSFQTALFEVQNIVTGAFSTSEDIVYVIGNGEDFFQDEKFFSPEETARRYGIFEVEGSNLVLKDEVQIQETIIIPYDTKLLIKAGTSIAIAPGSSLVSYSPVMALGNGNQPISVFSSNSNEPFGVFAMTGQEVSGSRFNYFNVENGSEAYINGIFFSGMFDVYNAGDISVENSSFNLAKADDALNFKYVSGEIKNSVFSKNSSDAIDFDFVDGKISNNRFLENGGDGIDLSGSKIVIRNNLIDGAGDKCISVGEASRPVIINNLLQKCKIGVAIKDLSYAVIANDVIRDNKVGINVFQKKLHFGPADGKVMRTIFDDNIDDVFFGNIDDSDSIDVIYNDLSKVDILDSNIDGYFVWNSGNVSEEIGKDIFWLDDISDQRIGLLFLPKHFSMQ